MNNTVEDYVEHGFHKLDDQYLEHHPPKIRWSVGWRDRSLESKVQYLEKLAATMNHAAKLLQSERDELGDLCAKKEEQLVVMAKQMSDNNAMLQQEVCSMNERRQAYHENIKALNVEIRKLRNGDHS